MNELVTLVLSREDFDRLAFLVTIGASVFSDWTKRDPERARETEEYNNVVGIVNALHQSLPEIEED